MIDFFTFTWSEVLTAIRFWFVSCWIFGVIFIVIIFMDTAVKAASYGRVLIGVIGGLKPREYFGFARHCYKYAKSGCRTKFKNGSYWNKVGDWSYLDKKTKQWKTKGSNK